MKETIKYFTVFAYLLIFTACGGGESKQVTTVPKCSNDAYYDRYDDKWYKSYDSDDECDPLDKPDYDGSHYNCPDGQVPVRVPKSRYSNNNWNQNYNNNCYTEKGRRYCPNNSGHYNNNNWNYNSSWGYNTNNNYNNTNSNYHRHSDQYTYTCANRNDRFVVGTGSYFYYNVHGSIQYSYSHNLDANSAAAVLGIIGAAVLINSFK